MQRKNLKLKKRNTMVFPTSISLDLVYDGLILSYLQKTLVWFC